MLATTTFWPRHPRSQSAGAWITDRFGSGAAAACSATGVTWIASGVIVATSSRAARSWKTSAAAVTDNPLKTQNDVVWLTQPLGFPGFQKALYLLLRGIRVGL